MKINSAEFVISAASAPQFPKTRLPEVAFVGKSNVGKSTLINSLLQRKNLVKTSATPGKTQTINFFLINAAFHLVDLPGYGYAQVPVDVQKAWKALIETYLAERSVLKGVVLIIDSRHGPNAADHQLFEWLQHYQVQTLVIANKFDKLKQNERRASLRQIQEAFSLETAPLPHSSLEKLGRSEIWQALQPWLEEPIASR